MPLSRAAYFECVYIKRVLQSMEPRYEDSIAKETSVKLEAPSGSKTLLRELTRFRSKLPPSPLVYLLFCAFGIGAWVAVNGVWGEISILVQTLPECDKLPSVLVVVIQLANVGPLLYTATKAVFAHRRWNQYHLEVVTVAILVLVGTAACVLLALFWNRTAYAFGERHGVSLITLTFFLATIDCTSAVVFFPFMRHFHKSYISALYIGAGLSGVLPSAAALAQGFVKYGRDCPGAYPGIAALGINFSPSVYFVLLSLLTLVCGVAFLLINVLPVARKQMLAPVRPRCGDLQQAATEEEGTVTVSCTNVVPLLIALVKSKFFLLLCLAVVNFISNGALPSFSAYAFLSYGSVYYHTGVNLAIIMAPVASFCHLFLPSKSEIPLVVLTHLIAILASYMLMIAMMYPQPLLVDHTAGGVIVVLVNVAISSMVAYVKVGVTVQLHSYSEKNLALTVGGVVNQLGSLLGAMLFFGLVYYTNIFEH